MSLQALFATPLIASRPARFGGAVRPRGEAGLAGHVMLMAGAAFGPSELTNLPPDPALDELAETLQALGVGVEWLDAEHTSIMIWGPGVGALALPTGPLVCNDPSRAAPLMGLFAPYDMTVRMSVPTALEPALTGIATALGQSGTNLAILRGERAVFALTGPRQPLPARAEKALNDLPTLEALFMAGLYPPGRTVLRLAEGLRTDLAAIAAGFGATTELSPHPEGGATLALTGQARLTGRDGAVPGAVDDALLPLLTALLVPEASLRIEAVARNARLGGLMSLLGAMQANITQSNPRTLFGVPVVDLEITYSSLTATTASAADIAAAGLDPALLAVLAAAATGDSRLDVSGYAATDEAADDPVAALVLGLTALGVAARRDADHLIVNGAGAIKGGATVEAMSDMRLARAFLLAGQCAAEPVAIDDHAALGPLEGGWVQGWRDLGANLAVGEGQFQ